MRKPAIVLALAALMLLSLGGVSPAHADAAPPRNPPGSSVSTGKFQTKVRMVSEKVWMTISDYTPPPAQIPMQEPFARGHVDATFNIQNQGDTAEAFDVWFPIGSETGYGLDTVDNFQAWVDGVPAAKIGRQETRDEGDDMVPWATWPATFPPGKPVTLKVSYDTYGRGFPPYATFTYILHTGAGWYGTIGEGTVTFRLPYDVNDLNTALSGDLDPFELYPFLAGGPYTVSGRDVIWHFADLEPTEADDIALTVLTPNVWRRIDAAKAFAEANPRSIPAQLDLARTAQQGLLIWGEVFIFRIGNTSKLVTMAEDAYEAALSLDPDNLDICIEYLNLLKKDENIATSLRDRYVRVLDRVKKLSPDNPQIFDFQYRLDMHTKGLDSLEQETLTATAGASDLATWRAERKATADFYSTLAEGVRLGVIPPPTATATLTDEQWATLYPHPSPEPTSAPTRTAAPTGTAPPTASPGPTPAPQSSEGSAPDWTGVTLLALIAVIVVAAWLARRSRPPGP